MPQPCPRCATPHHPREACGADVSLFAWAPEPSDAERELAEHNVPQTRRLRGDVHEQIDWERLHVTTRVKPTSTAFGWRGRLLLTLPPWLVVAYWLATGALLSPLLPIGLWIIGGAVWWTKNVWTRTRWRERD